MISERTMNYVLFMAGIFAIIIVIGFLGIFLIVLTHQVKGFDFEDCISLYEEDDLEGLSVCNMIFPPLPYQAI